MGAHPYRIFKGRNRQKNTGQKGGARRGQGLVEFALVSILLFALLMTIMDAARFMLAYSAVSNAAQEGTRYGVLRPRDLVGSTEATQIAQNATRTPTAVRHTYIDNQVVGDTACSAFSKTREHALGIASSSVNVAAWYDAGDGTPIAVTNSGDLQNAAIPGNRVVVEATYHFDFIVPYMGVFAPNGVDIKMRSARTILSVGDDPTYHCAVNYTPAPTYTPSATFTRTATATPTFTSTPTSTNTATNTPTGTATATITRTYTPTSTRTLAPTWTPTGTGTATPTATPFCPFTATVSAIRDSGGTNQKHIQPQATIRDISGHPVSNLTVTVRTGKGEQFTLVEISPGSGVYRACSPSNSYDSATSVLFIVSGTTCSVVFVPGSTITTVDGSITSCP